MAARPYINYSAKELESSVEANKGNILTLKKIAKEIGFRKKAERFLAPSLSKAKEYILAAGLTEQKSKMKEPPDQEQEQEQVNQDITLGKPGSIRRASSELKKLPQAWSPELKDTFVVKGLDEAQTPVEKFICALRGLIFEIRRSAKFSKTINLINGRKEKTLSGEYGSLYSFIHEGDEDLFEGSRVDFRAGPKKTKGSIVSMLPGKPRKIILSLDEDFGDRIPQCSITQDEAALLEALQKRLEIEVGQADKKAGSPVGMNTYLADLLLKGKSDGISPEDYGKVDTSGLNQGQKAFVEKAVKHTVSFLWGPPGTGKTQTLGSIIAYFYQRKERTLICSNTNQAVDQVLLKLCKELKNQDRITDLEEGKIIRVGKISHAELYDSFGKYITVDGIVERKGAKISEKIRLLKVERAILERNFLVHQTIIDEFLSLKKLKDDQKNASAKADKVKHKIKLETDNCQKMKYQLKMLNYEKSNYGNKSFLTKLFVRGIVLIEADIQVQNAKIKRTESSLLTLADELRHAQNNQPDFSTKILHLEAHLKGKVLSIAEEICRKERQKISSIDIDLLSLSKQIEDLKKVVVSQATVVGTTLTKSFLSPSDLGKFQNVVIDEASMGLLPAVYFAASQSERRCIISGDFRQLPPIIQSENLKVVDIIGKDVFEYSGLKDIFIKKLDCSYAAVLREQYRMDPKICDLISEIGYEGELFTSKDRNPKITQTPSKFTDSVIIIDTSSLCPFTNRDPFGSTSNMVHALLARNIMKEFIDTDESGSLGYCAPFAAQTKLLKKMVIGEPNEDQISIGTVHTFQGDEKNTMIFDTVNSLGEKFFIHPNLAQETASKSNILTVAISRAQQRTVIIANLRYLDTKIPALGYLRKILYNAQAKGTVIDAKDIIDLVPLKADLEKFSVDFQELEISDSALKSGLVNEDVFFPLLERDINQAKRYIAFYSGFYTAKRVDKLLPLLAEKIKSGVKIRAVIPPPYKNGSMGEVESNMVAEKLESEGILVEFRARIHQKAVLIDEDVSWFGSLNPLSFSGGTEESMLRVEQKNTTGIFAANMAVNRNFAKDDSSLMVCQEIPNCSYCKGKTVFYRGRNGPYVKCLSCTKTANLKSF